jgi:hypothetical protein
VIRVYDEAGNVIEAVSFCARKQKAATRQNVTADCEMLLLC